MDNIYRLYIGFILALHVDNLPGLAIELQITAETMDCNTVTREERRERIERLNFVAKKVHVPNTGPALRPECSIPGLYQ